MATPATPAPDAALTLTLAAASLAAYADYQGQSFAPPANYTLLGRFTGWDGWLGPFDKEEKFGLIFESSSAPGTYIVAFRGTDSTLDIIEDSFWDFCDFTPFRNALPAATQVSTGFSDIYLTRGGTMTASMQQQIFALLPQHPAQLYVTGHSLGAAISQLFTLDAVVSAPGVPVQTINFASPRVGSSSWQAACAQTGATACITRIINYHDLVPDYPMEILGYVSLGAELEVAFRRIRWWEYNEISNHSMLNLQTVLTNCLPLTPPVWTGTFPDHVNPSYTMSSTPAPAMPRAEWQAKLLELHATASAAPPLAAPLTPAGQS